MYSIILNDINLEQIANSGQCFRMNCIKKDTYSIIAFGKYIEVSQCQNTINFSCDEN